MNDEYPFEEVVAEVEATRRKCEGHWNRLGFASAEKQLANFRFVVEHVDFVGKRILDIGCGFADFKTFMDERGVKYERYTCIEAAPSVYERLREERPEVTAYLLTWPRLTEEGREALRGEYDVVTSISCVYALRELEHVWEWLERAYEVADEIVVFDWQNPYNERWEKVLEICRSICRDSEIIGYDHGNRRGWVSMRKRGEENDLLDNGKVGRRQDDAGVQAGI